MDFESSNKTPSIGDGVGKTAGIFVSFVIRQLIHNRRVILSWFAINYTLLADCLLLFSKLTVTFMLVKWFDNLFRVIIREKYIVTSDSG